ncbi:hypothetical protein BACCAP_00824 [Pseudoflavonifractor capillosus ATCC 29799]|uniref:Uncharacterized protein n=1 Tax=Pseudoflavonifractor capillosus ATCC 29799 TaxID=411467 RepID=A6NRJ6_9FIRM|nr:hypothetical protein BACCAP_00824 [Pseudoflavonifractor capillosus ATCC 29799]
MLYSIKEVYRLLELNKSPGQGKRRVCGKVTDTRRRPVRAEGRSV